MKSIRFPASLLLTLLLFLGLSACSSSAPQPDAWKAATRGQRARLAPASTLAGITVPILQHAELRRAWGVPSIERDASGQSYLLTYKHPQRPFTRLMIHGLSQPLPSLATPPPLRGEEMVNDRLNGFQRPQSWRELLIAGQKVRWFQESSGGGADGASYSTEGFSLRGPDGRIGYYRLSAEILQDPAVVVSWFRGVGFGE